MSAAALLEMRGIGKRFPGVTALDDVSLSLARGEVVALLGENGAGKSTLMNILGGVLRPDSGEVRIDGTAVRTGSAAEARRHGIGFIHQELNLADNLDVAGNVFLGREPVRGPFRLLDRRRMLADSVRHLHRLGLDVTPDTPLARLPIAHRQLVEIAKALSLDARILIMDEPTSSLTLSETDRLLEVVAGLRADGVSILYISHRLTEVAQCADRAVVLRDGRNAGELGRNELDHDRMVRLMVGRDAAEAYQPGTCVPEPGYFQVRGMRSRRYPDRAVSLDAARGEILGIAGLIGSGRSELAETVFGVDGHSGGEIRVGGERVHVRRCGDAIRHGIYLVPEDRRASGLVTGMNVRENITLASLPTHSRFGLVRRALEAGTAERYLGELSIKAPSIETGTDTLSGGNQQKVVLAKWLSMQPRVLLFDEPTRGIDVGAKAEIHRLMRGLADRGVVVLMISSDMEEIRRVSDRIAVMHEGRIAGVLERADVSETNILRLAVGQPVTEARPPAPTLS